MTKAETTRSVEKILEVEAPVEAVWAALTEAEELTRWFPLEAEVVPGEGGSIKVAWGEESGQAKIEVWEPNKRISLATEEPGEGGEAIVLRQDYVIEALSGGRTRMTLVHSGFGGDSAWDAMFDAVDRGWDFELRGLQHYLERHRGTPRRVVHARRFLDMPHERSWELLAGPGGLAKAGDLNACRAGERFSFEMPTGDVLEGEVTCFGPPKDFAAILSNANDAYLRIRSDFSCVKPDAQEVNLWLSTYGLAEDEVTRWQSSFEKVLGDLFGS